MNGGKTVKKNEKKYHHGDLKAALVRAGLEILREGGLAALSLRAIAARVGVSHTAPRNHFAGLDALLAAIAAEGFRMHAAAMRAGVEDAPRGRARLHAAAEGYTRFARENPALFQIMFSPRFKDTEDADLRAAGAESYAVLRDIAEGLVWDRPGPGAVPEVEAVRSEVMLWTLVHGYAELEINGQIPADGAGRPLLGPLDVMPAFRYAWE
jgi:AcrR family transcriptional regulator